MLEIVGFLPLLEVVRFLPLSEVVGFLPLLEVVGFLPLLETVGFFYHAYFGMMTVPHKKVGLEAAAKPVYSNHSRDQVIMAFVDRCSLCRCVLVLFWWFKDQPTVVSIDRWSFYTGGL